MRGGLQKIFKMTAYYDNFVLKKSDVLIKRIFKMVNETQIPPLKVISLAVAFLFRSFSVPAMIRKAPRTLTLLTRSFTPDIKWPEPVRHAHHTQN